MNFDIDDKVTARGIAYWLTITDITPSGWVVCKFGAIGGYAGKFRAGELSMYTGG